MEINQIYSLDSKQLHQFFKILPTSAMIVDKLGNIVWVNQELLDTLGYDFDFIVGKNVNILLPIEYRNHHSSLISMFFDKPVKRQMGAGRELYALTKSDKKIPIEIGLNPVKVDGKDLVLATLIDVSARVHASKMFASAVNHAPYGVLVISTSGKITFANEALLRCFGYKNKEVVGEPLEILLPHRYRSHHQNLMDSYLASPEERMMGVGRDLTALHSDGVEFPVEIGLRPFYDENNQEMVLVSLVDITERKRTELSLKEKNINLEEFTYVASHDLRSPLRGIADLLEWISEDLGADCKPEINKNLDRISVRIERMEELIENLLIYAKSGNISSEIKKVNIHSLIENILSLAEVPNNFNIVIDISVDYVKSAMTPLETVLRNLIFNALKHHDKESGCIRISCHSEGSMLHFEISDDGPGIPELSKDRIFKLFQTVTASERGTSGIGLSVCRRLTDTHGGNIYAENNTEQRGATFHLLWPNYLRRDMHD